MTAYMTPVQCTEPHPSEILYDYDIKKQRTRLFQTDKVNSAIDIIMDEKNSHWIQRFRDGSFKCLKPLHNLGIVKPDWLKRSKADIAGVLKDNPRFGPEKTILIMTCPITSMLMHSMLVSQCVTLSKSHTNFESLGVSNIENRYFWTWYTNEGEPIMFMETEPPKSEGAGLALADYQCFCGEPSVDPSAFEVPCMEPAENGHMVGE